MLDQELCPLRKYQLHSCTGIRDRSVGLAQVQPGRHQPPPCRTPTSTPFCNEGENKPCKSLYPQRRGEKMLWKWTSLTIFSQNYFLAIFLKFLRANQLNPFGYILISLWLLRSEVTDTLIHNQCHLAWQKSCLHSLEHSPSWKGSEVITMTQI